jgi:hypothetical protein
MGNKHRNKPGHRDSANDHDAPAQTCKFQAGSVYSVRIQPTPEDTQRQQDEKEHWGKQITAAKWQNWITAFAALFAAVVAVIYYCQLISMQKSVELNRQAVELNRQALEVSERPWVSVGVLPYSDLTFVDGKQAVVGLRFSLKNVGKSIAKGIQIDVKMFPTSPGLPVALDAAANQAKLCDHPPGHPAFDQIDLFPDQPEPRELSVSAAPTAVEKSAAYAAGDKSRSFVGFYVVGCVSYHFSFGTKMHQTRFAYHLVGPFSGFTPSGKPIMLQDGKAIVAGFEVGVKVPKDKLGMMQELFALNDAN